MPVTSATSANSSNTIITDEKLKEYKETIDQMNARTQSVIGGANAAADQMVDQINNSSNNDGTFLQPGGQMLPPDENVDGGIAEAMSEPKKRDKPKVSYAPPANNNISTAIQSKVTSPIGTAKPSKF